MHATSHDPGALHVVRRLQVSRAHNLVADWRAVRHAVGAAERGPRTQPAQPVPARPGPEKISRRLQPTRCSSGARATAATRRGSEGAPAAGVAATASSASSRRRRQATGGQRGGERAVGAPRMVPWCQLYGRALPCTRRILVSRAFARRQRERLGAAQLVLGTPAQRRSHGRACALRHEPRQGGRADQREGPGSSSSASTPRRASQRGTPRRCTGSTRTARTCTSAASTSG